MAVSMALQQNTIFKARLEEFEALGLRLLEVGTIDKKEVDTLVGLAAKKTDLLAIGSPTADDIIKAASGPPRRTLQGVTSDAVAEILLNRHPATLNSKEIGAWIYFAGSVAERLQILSKDGEPWQKATAAEAIETLNLLRAHSKFRFAVAELHLLHTMACGLLGLGPDPRFVIEGEAWLKIQSRAVKPTATVAQVPPVVPEAVFTSSLFAYAGQGL